MRKLLTAFLIGLWFALPIKVAEAIYPYPQPIYTVAATGCSQATTFLARTSGLSGTQSGAYTTMICGMVSDGTWSLLDALYVFATNTTSTANLNLVSTSYPLTASGTPTFTANAGYTGNGSAYLSEPTNLSSFTNFTQNSAALGSCDLTNRTTAQSYYSMGVHATTSESSIDEYDTGGTFYVINSNGQGNYTSSTSSIGSHIVSRTSSASMSLYLNGTSVDTTSAPSQPVPSYAFYVLAYNISGSAYFQGTDQIGYAFVGSGMTSTQALAMYNRLHTFLTTVGAPSGC